MGSIFSLKVGDTIGQLTLVELLPKIKGKLRTARVLCSCGKEKIVVASDLARGHMKTCGDRIHQKTLPIGLRCGKLVVIETGFHERRYGLTYKTCKCKCDCGNIGFYLESDIRLKKLKSCGCLKRVNPRAEYGRWKCHACEIIFNTKKELSLHNKKFHPCVGFGWRKGHTKEDDPRISKGAETLKRNIANGTVIPTWKNKTFPLSMRKNISIGTKKAHSEHRANTWAMSRHKGGWRTSQPEKDFIVILDNLGVQYVREYPLKGFSIDFAFINDKKAIEIDGEQHYQKRFDTSSDRRKEAVLAECGWKLLRIRWEKEKKDKGLLIDKVKQFLNGATSE